MRKEAAQGFRKEYQVIPMRPCTLCGFFVVLEGANDPLASFAHCDTPDLARFLHRGQLVSRCPGFRYIHTFTDENGRELRQGFEGLGIGAPITTDAKSQFETNRGENARV